MSNTPSNTISSKDAFTSAAEVTQPDAKAQNLLENVYLTPAADLTPLQVSGPNMPAQNVQWSASAFENQDGVLAMQGFSVIYKGADGEIHTANASMKTSGGFEISVDGVQRAADGTMKSVVSGREDTSVSPTDLREGAGYLNSALSFARNDPAIKEFPQLQEQVSDMAHAAYAQSPLADMQMQARGPGMGQ